MSRKVTGDASGHRRRTASQELHYWSHPLDKVRKVLIVSSCVGVVLGIVSTTDWYYSDKYSSVGIVISPLAASGFFALCDLQLYAIDKLRNPGHDLEWPAYCWMVGDAVLAVRLLLLCVRAELSGRGILAAWAEPAVLVSAVLHAVSFWKQLMARYKNAQSEALALAPCARYDYQTVEAVPHDPPATGSMPPNLSTYAGLPADFARANILMPEGTESAMEEGLLIGSEVNSGYGSIERGEAEPVVDQPAEMVVEPSKKNRGSGSAKKRAEA